MAVHLEHAMRLALDLDRFRACIPSRYDDREGYEAGVAALHQAIVNADPRGVLRQDFRGCTIRAHGITTTCTAGVVGACGNYIRRVEQLSGLPLRRDGGA